MMISVINRTNGVVKDREILFAIRAINRQINEDFFPYWSFGSSLRLEGSTEELPNKEHPEDMRGDAVIYMWDKVDTKAALGYHDQNFSGIPYGFVFTRLASQLHEDWSVTLSHEALEITGDPETNLLVMGPHPDPLEHRNVFHMFEMCDAVQAESYEIDGIAVSNFVLPLYYTSGDEFKGRNDFLGTTYRGKTLESFGVNHGGYIGFFDPREERTITYFGKSDLSAKKRSRIKLKAKGTRRLLRYRNFVTPGKNMKFAKQETKLKM